METNPMISPQIVHAVMVVISIVALVVVWKIMRSQSKKFAPIPDPVPSQGIQIPTFMINLSRASVIVFKNTAFPYLRVYEDHFTYRKFFKVDVNLSDITEVTAKQDTIPYITIKTSTHTYDINIFPSNSEQQAELVEFFKRKGIKTN